MFRESALADVIVFIVVTVGAFPILTGVFGSKWSKKVVEKFFKRSKKRINEIREIILPTYMHAKSTKRIRITEPQKLLDDVARSKRSDMLPTPGDIARNARMDPMSSYFQDHAGPEDVEMVPGYNFGPGIFRMYDIDTKVDQLEDAAHADLVFTARTMHSSEEDSSEDASGRSDSASSYTGSDTDHPTSIATNDETTSNFTARSVDIQPEPLLGPVRVRHIQIALSEDVSESASQVSRSSALARSSRETATTFTLRAPSTRSYTSYTEVGTNVEGIAETAEGDEAASTFTQATFPQEMDTGISYEDYTEADFSDDDRATCASSSIHVTMPVGTNGRRVSGTSQTISQYTAYTRYTEADFDSDSD